MERVMYTKKQQAAHLRKLAKYLRERVGPLEKTHRNFHMGLFVFNSAYLVKKLFNEKFVGWKVTPKCGTAACMAGHATNVFPELSFKNRYSSDFVLKGFKGLDSNRAILNEFFGDSDIFYGHADSAFDGAEQLESLANILAPELNV